MIYITRSKNITSCQLIFPCFNRSFQYCSTWEDTRTYYFLIIFVSYYCVPAVLILTFYMLLLRRLKKQDDKNLLQKRSWGRGKVTKSILLVILFYFFCWTPYWVVHVLMMTGVELPDWQQHLQNAIFTLPYLNSAFNPVFYGWLNQRLRQTYCRNWKISTTGSIFVLNLGSLSKS